MANNNLKISILGTLDVTSTVTEINTKLLDVQRKINAVQINVQVSPQTQTALNNLTQQVQNLGNANTRNATQNASNQINNIGNAARQSSGHVQTFGQSLQNATQKFGLWLITANLIYAPIRALQDMTARLLEIDQIMTDIRRVMDVPDFKFTEMLEEAVVASDELSGKLTDLLSKMAEFGRMGFSENQLLDITKTAQVLQNISDLDSTAAVNTLTSAMLNFNIAASDSLTIADKLNEVDNNFAISTKDLSDGIRKAAATAKTFGVDLNELTGYIAAIGSTTRESGSIVGNGLKTIFSRLTTIEGAETALNSANVAMKDMQGNVRPVSDILEDLAGNWTKLSDEQRQNLSVTLAGRYQLTRFLALMNNFEIAQSATASAINSSGSAMKEQETYADSLEARINRLDTAWNKFTLSAANVVLTDGLIGGIETLNDLATGVAKLVDSFGLLSGLFGTVGVAVVLLSTRFRTFATSVMFGTASLTPMQVATTGLTTAMTRLGVATVGVKAAIRGLLASTVVGAIFVGIGFALEKLIGKYSEAKQAQEEFEQSQQKGIDALTKNRKETESLISRYEEMTEAKKKMGESWSTKQEEDYLQLQQRLGELYPQLISYIDATGQTHIKNKEQIDEERKATEKLIIAKKEELKLKALDNLTKVYDDRSDIKKDISAKEKEIEDGKMYKGKTFEQAVAKAKSDVASLQYQWSQASQKITGEVLKIADAYINLEIDPNLRQGVDDFVASLDLSKLNPEELEIYSKRIGETVNALQKAYQNGDRTGFEKAKQSLIEYAETMGATEHQTNAFKMSFYGLKKAAEQGANAIFAGKDGMDGLDDSTLGLTDDMYGLTDAVDSTTGALDANITASEILLGVNGDQIAQLQTAIAIYSALAGQQGLSAEQEIMLANATSILTSMYPHLNGQISENIGWISSQVGMMSSLNDVSGANAATMITNQNSTTKATIEQINQRIAGYQKEINALQKVQSSIANSYDDEGLNGFKKQRYINASKRISELQVELASAQASKTQVIYDSGVKTGQVKPYNAPSSGSGSKGNKGSGSKGSGSDRTVEVEQLDRYKMKMDELNNTIEESEFLTKRLDKTSSLYRSELEKQSQAYEEMSTHTLGQISSLEKRNKVIQSQISAMGDVNRLSNEQKEILNALNKELESNTSEVYNLKSAWRGYQEQMLSMQDDLRDSIASQISEEQTKREEILQKEIDETNELYDERIKQQQDQLDLLEETEEVEDRIANLREKENDINKAKSDKRYSYITAQGEEILTFNKEQVSELEKERDQMVKEYERADLKKALQDEINRLNKAKDDANKALNQRLSDFKKFWDKMVSDARSGTLSFDTLQRAWQDKSISSLTGHVNNTGVQLNNIGGMYSSLGVIAKNLDAKAQQINTSLYTARNTMNSTMSGMTNDANNFGSGYNGVLGGIAGAAGSVLGSMQDNANKTKVALGRTLGELEAVYNKLIKKATEYESKQGNDIAAYSGIYQYYRQRMAEYHTGGIVGGFTSDETEFANKLFNAKPNEQVAKLLRGEVVINPMLPNVKNNINNLQNLLANGSRQVGAIDQSKHININNPVIKANNPLELFQGIDNLIRSY